MHDFPMVLWDETAQDEVYQVHHSFQGVFVASTAIDSFPQITGQERLGCALKPNIFGSNLCT